MATNAWAGESFQQQKMQVQKAYHAVKPVKEPCEDLFEGIEVDALDKLYVQTRTVMDSWMIWVFFLVGAITILPFFLGKFGVRFQSPFRKRD